MVDYDIDEFYQSGATNEKGVAEAEAKAKEAEAQKQQEEAAKEAAKQAAEDKARLEKEIEVLKAQAQESEAFRKRIAGEGGQSAKAQASAYENLIKKGVKPEEIKGYEAFHKAFIEETHGIPYEQYMQLQKATVGNAHNSAATVAEINYENQKTRLFAEIQQENPAIRPDYFKAELEAIEKQLTPEQLMAYKVKPPEQLYNDLKQTYINVVGKVTADKEAKAKYEKYLAEHGDAAREDKQNSSNPGGFSSNMARDVGDGSQAGPVPLQDAIDSALFST